ncbi:MAG: phage head-tail adapter protein, partial [Defluviitaleaceae bacterium]|nr:phage head-tail adapter protein [Defluviitaleaceae bacterium]
NSPIITTGNEIARDGLIEFSKALDLKQLREYVIAVMSNTNTIIECMNFQDSKTKVSEERKAKVVKSNTVSTDESTFWLVDYWCNKTYAGLMLMPFSRHIMLHLDGCLRIINKIKK